MNWLEEKMRTIGDWTSVTFPEQTAVGKLCHLREEIGELIEAIAAGERDNIAVEYADCQILLLDVARALGMSPAEVDAAIDGKMEVNMKRKWSQPDLNGICRHID
ncbi:MAG: DUF550 domain-containing protein [Rikenellaceae bacterium]|nr:DUF550 domain-containing protein [Rikenellaceae bacterium]